MSEEPELEKGVYAVVISPDHKLRCGSVEEVVRNSGIAVIVPDDTIFVYAVYSDRGSLDVVEYASEYEMLDIIEEQYGKDVVKMLLNCKVV